MRKFITNIFAAALIACAWAVPAEAQAYRLETADISTLQAYGTASPSILYAHVVSLDANYDWVNAPCTPDGSPSYNYVPGDGGTGSVSCWYREFIGGGTFTSTNITGSTGIVQNGGTGTNVSGTFVQLNLGRNQDGTLSSADRAEWCTSALDQHNSPYPRDFVPVCLMPIFSTLRVSGTSGSNVITDNGAEVNFLPGAVGAKVSDKVSDGGLGCIPLGTTISTFTSITVVVLSNNLTCNIADNGDIVQFDFTGLPGFQFDLSYWHHRGFELPYDDMGGIDLSVSRLLNVNMTVSSGDAAAAAGVGYATDITVDGTDLTKITTPSSNILTGKDSGGTIRITGTTSGNCVIGWYDINSSYSSPYYDLVGQAFGTAGSVCIGYINMGLVRVNQNNYHTYIGGRFAGSSYKMIDVTDPKDFYQSADNQGYFSGYDPVAGANTANGGLVVGWNGQGTTNGLSIRYNGHQAYIGNQYVSTGDTIVFQNDGDNVLTLSDASHIPRATAAGLLELHDYAIGSLPSATGALLARVTDANAACVIGTTAVAGGSTKCFVAYNGSLWVETGY